ncbi:radical SAM protein [archaeon]|nr:radical SAM protein [archaeon]
MNKISTKLIKDILIVYLLRRKVPINVMFYLTNRCNLKCIYCQIQEHDNKNEIDTKTLIRSIKELDKLGCIRIGLIGGEPLLRHDFGQIIDACNKNNILVDVYTNGYLAAKKSRKISLPFGSNLLLVAEK